MPCRRGARLQVSDNVVRPSSHGRNHSVKGCWRRGPIGRDAVACPIEEALSIFGYRSERLVRDCGHTSPELFSRDAAPGAATYFDGCGVEHLILGLTPT